MALYDLGLLVPPMQIFDYVAYRRSQYLECLHEADEGNYDPLCHYIRRGIYDALEQFIAETISSGPHRDFFLRRLDRRAKRFLDRRYRLELYGKTYERERRHFFRSVRQASRAAAKRDAKNTTRPD